jgi:hypothetical protein
MDQLNTFQKIFNDILLGYFGGASTGLSHFSIPEMSSVKPHKGGENKMVDPPSKPQKAKGAEPGASFKNTSQMRKKITTHMVKPICCCVFFWSNHHY